MLFWALKLSRFAIGFWKNTKFSRVWKSSCKVKILTLDKFFKNVKILTFLIVFVMKNFEKHGNFQHFRKICARSKFWPCTNFPKRSKFWPCTNFSKMSKFWPFWNFDFRKAKIWTIFKTTFSLKFSKNGWNGPNQLTLLFILALYGRKALSAPACECFATAPQIALYTAKSPQSCS